MSTTTRREQPGRPGTPALLLLAALLGACAEEAAPDDCLGVPTEGGRCEVELRVDTCADACTAENCRLAYESCKLAPFWTAPDYRICAGLVPRDLPGGADYSYCARACTREGGGAFLKCFADHVDTCEAPNTTCDPSGVCMATRFQEVRDLCSCSWGELPADNDCTRACWQAANDCDLACPGTSWAACLDCSEQCQMELPSCLQGCAGG